MGFLFAVLVAGVVNTGYASDVGHLVTSGSGQTDASPDDVLISNGQNPAALIYQTSSQFFLLGASEDDQFDPLAFGGGILYGDKGMMAVGVGVETNTSKDHPFRADGEFAIGLKDIAAVGLGVEYDFDQKDFDGRIGLIFLPKGEFHLGVSAYSLAGGVNALGAGLSYEASKTLTLTLDGTSDQKFKSRVLSPSIKVNYQILSIMGGYAWALDDKELNFAQVTHADEIFLGFGFEFERTGFFKFYYQHQDAQYFFAAGFAF